MKLEAKGKLLTSSTGDERNMVIKTLADKLAKSAQEAIQRGFERNVQLAAMVGSMADQEAVRAITRSLRVEVRSIDPLRLEAKFKDDLGHWYGGGELPDDLAKLLQDVMDKSLQDWFGFDAPGKILAEVMNA